MAHGWKTTVQQGKQGGRRGSRPSATCRAAEPRRGGTLPLHSAGGRGGSAVGNGETPFLQPTGGGVGQQQRRQSPKRTPQCVGATAPRVRCKHSPTANNDGGRRAMRTDGPSKRTAPAMNKKQLLENGPGVELGVQFSFCRWILCAQAAGHRKVPCPLRRVGGHNVLRRSRAFMAPPLCF